MDLVVAARGPRDQDLESIFQELPDLDKTEELFVLDDDDDEIENEDIEANGERTILRYRETLCKNPKLLHRQLVEYVKFHFPNEWKKATPKAWYDRIREHSEFL